MQLDKIEMAIHYSISSECEEALHDPIRYQGATHMWKNYDEMLTFINSYQNDRELREKNEDNAFISWVVQLIMYIAGSVCVIIHKVYEIRCCRKIDE